MRSLAADGSFTPVAGVTLAAVLLGGWTAWLVLGRITLYEVTGQARLEVGGDVRPVQAMVSGRLASTQLTLGQEVCAGEVLAELDSEAERRRLQQERTRLLSLAPQIAALRRELSAQRHAHLADSRTVRVASDAAHARDGEAEVSASFAEEEAKRLTTLQGSGYVAEMDILRARVEARRRRAAEHALALDARRLDTDILARRSHDRVRVEELRREIALLEGEQATLQAATSVLEQEIEKRRIRAPISGRVGEVAPVRAGAFVKDGDRLGVIVPKGALLIVAEYLPAEAFGRLRTGQAARLRLDGFPWVQYGSVPARVERVAGEVRDGRVRVELGLVGPPPAAIPLQHGLPGAVEIEVERLAPAALLLRAAGQLLVRPALGREGAGPGGN